MADFLGTIEVPEIIPTGEFPFISDYPHGRTEEQLVATHRFPLGDGKTEQRFLLGSIARTFSFKRQALCQEDKDALVSFWETNQGALGLFTYNSPNEDGSTTPYIVRFKDQTLTIDGIIGSIMSAGVEMIEVVDNATVDALTPYPLNAVNTRFPGSTLKSALLQPTQQVIPLIKLTPREVGYDPIYLSDRRCTIGSQLYLQRLLKRGPIEMGVNGETAPVTLTFGNADTVMTLLARSVNLDRADVEIAFYHVVTGIRLDYFKGYTIDYQLDETPEFSIQVAEGLYELTLAYPVRKLTKSCWRVFNNVKSGCPWATAGSGGDPLFCDKGFNTTKGCASHGMTAYFGGIEIQPQTIRVKDNTTGFAGFGRNTLSLTSEVASSIFGLPLPEIYCDFSEESDPTLGLSVNCFLAAGGDEGDFYAALGIVCAGPIGAYAEASGAFSPYKLDGQAYFGWPLSTAGLTRSYGHSPAQDHDPDRYSDRFYITNSGDTPEGSESTPRFNTQTGGVAFVQQRITSPKGLQIDALADHKMQVSVRKGLGGYTWTEPGSRTFADTGLKSPVWVTVNMLLRALGLWGAPPTDSVDIADQEAVVDVQAAADIVSTITDIVVPVIIGGNPGGGQVSSTNITSPGSSYTIGDVLSLAGGDGQATLTVLQVGQSGEVVAIEITTTGGTYTNGTGVSPTGGSGSGLVIDFTATSITDGTETQFRYAGVIAEEQTLKDWLIQVMNTYLGIFNFSFGKFRLISRNDSSVRSAFSIGNVLLGSTFFAPRAPSFNRLVANFADKDYGFQGNSIDIYDETHSKFLGTVENPKFLRSEINLSSVFTRSQTARIGVTRLREEVSGFTLAEFLYGCNLKFSTTLLAAEIEPGMVCSIEVDRAPNYPATYTGSTEPGAPPWPTNVTDPQAAKDQYVEFRVTKMTLQEDYRMDVEGVSTHNDIYAYTAGPHPKDVQADPLPTDNRFAPGNWKYRAYTNKDGNLILGNFAVGSNSLSVHLGMFEIFYIDEPTSFYSRLIQTIAHDATVVPFEGTPPKEGAWFLIEKEIFKVVKVHPVVGHENLFSAVEVERGLFGTQAVEHSRVITHVLEIDPDFHNRMRVDTGLNLHPGQRLFNAAHSVYTHPNGQQDPSPSPTNIDFTTADGGFWTPAVGQEMIGEYDPVTGWLVLARPFWGDDDTIATNTVGDIVYSDPRIWNIQLKQHEISFQPRFFSSIKRAAFEEKINLPMAGIVTIRGQLENTRGLRSNVVALFPIGSDTMEPRALPYSPPWPYFIRTLGNHRFVAEAADITDGTHIDVFKPIPVAESQSFEYALATIPGGPNNPLATPPAITSIVPTAAAPSGKLIFSGEINADLEIQVIVHSGNEVRSKTWYAKDNNIDEFSIFVDVAISLSDWLNNIEVNDVFAGFYTAIAKGNGDVWLQDNFAFGGTIDTNVSGGIIVEASGFTSVLGILQGRKYSAVFRGGENNGDSSTLSRSSGPTGDFRAIQIQDVPDSAEGADSVDIYATPDGQDAPLYLIGNVVVGVQPRVFLDDTPESELSSKPIFAGSVQEAVAGVTKLHIKRNGVPWFDLRVLNGTNVSNTIHGFAIDPVSQDVIINADTEGDVGGDFDVVLEMQ